MWLGIILATLYILLFAQGMREAIAGCPSFLCDLGLEIMTIPWAYMLDTAYSPFENIPTYPHILIFYIVFGILNTAIVYSTGRGITYIWSCIRKKI